AVAALLELRQDHLAKLVARGVARRAKDVGDFHASSNYQLLNLCLDGAWGGFAAPKLLLWPLSATHAADSGHKKISLEGLQGSKPPAEQATTSTVPIIHTQEPTAPRWAPLSSTTARSYAGWACGRAGAQARSAPARSEARRAPPRPAARRLRS